MTQEQLNNDPLAMALAASKLAQAAKDLTPAGVEFWCDCCNKRLAPRTQEKRNMDQSMIYGFGCHGLRASRSFTATGLAGLATREGQGFGLQRVNIYNMDGSVATGATLGGMDPQTASDVVKAKLPTPPTNQPAPKAAPSKFTVNDPPPKPTVGLTPEIATFGKRKVRFASDDGGEE